MTRALVLPGAALVAALGLHPVARPQAPASPSPATDVCNIQTTERIVAVADVHGAYDKFTSILRKAGILDQGLHWSGGKTIFVQLGDVTDRGAESRKTMDMLRRMEGEAAAAGGSVYALLGNHEVMRVTRDYRYVSRGEYAEFQTPESKDVRDRYFARIVEATRARALEAKQKFDEKSVLKDLNAETPLGLVEMDAAFGPSGEYWQWLQTHHIMVRINRIAFLHGGTSPKVAAMGCSAINAQARAELKMARGTTLDQQLEMIITSPDGPLWYRALASEDSAIRDSEVAAIMKTLDIRAMVMGHTVAPDSKAQWHFGRRALQLDSGMLGGSLYKGGAASALEIVGDTFTIITERGKQTIQPPPQ